MNAFYERFCEQLHRHTKIAQTSMFRVLACPCLSLLVHAALHLRAGACRVLPKGGRGLRFAPIRGLGMGFGRWLAAAAAQGRRCSTWRLAAAADGPRRARGAVLPHHRRARFQRRHGSSPRCSDRWRLCKRRSSGRKRRTSRSSDSRRVQPSPRRGEADTRRGVPRQHGGRPHSRRCRPPSLMQRLPHLPRLQSKGAIGCRGPTTPTRRCTNMCMRCPALAG